MTRLPVVTARQLVKALKKIGFEERHQRGSHLRLFNPSTLRQTTVPMHGGTLKRGTLHTTLKQADLSVEALQELL